MRMTWPGASGGRIGSGIGDGGSALAGAAATRAHTTALSVAQRVLTRGSELGSQQLGYLNCVQRSAFSQVVAGHEQCETSPIGHTGIMADPADQ